MKKGKIKVLVVEDSNVVLMLLVRLLNADPGVQVVGTARNGREALQFLAGNSPDVILMDIQMPVMDGLEATRRIMESNPVPIVICSGTNRREAMSTFRLMEVGAVAFVEKPLGMEHAGFEVSAARLLETVKLMSEVKVVRRWSSARHDSPMPGPPASFLSKPVPRKVQLIGIGASTGGPPVLQTIFAALPTNFPVPILVVQHIAPGFLEGLVDWLNQTTGLKTRIGAYGMSPAPGNVYLAPDGFHMTINSERAIVLNKSEPESGLRPSVGWMFRGMAETCGAHAIGVLLTGMGRDGAVDLKRMKDRGALTIAQDRESSIVHGMPGEAIALGAVTFVLPPAKIAAALIAQVGYS